MRKPKSVLLSLILAVFCLLPYRAEAQVFLKSRLKRIPGVVSVEELPEKSPIKAKYLIWFEQPIDHNDPAQGTFKQRIFLMHNSFDSPMVITTEGYAAGYAERADFEDELVSLFNTSQMVVEHRYFGKSIPEKGWEYLTVENAAADHHRIIQAFKKRYHGKWISTGISKGGTTCLIHRVLYPNDVDITIPYVAPLNFGVEDGRHESFVATTGTPETREGIRKFQAQVLMRRDKMIPMLENYVKKNELTYKIGLDELLDYLVLEYAFSFYQWGWNPSAIPAEDASDEAIFLHLVLVSSPDYFAIESFDSFLPFFVQAAKQLGYYGYEIHPFWELMTISSTRGYMQKIFLPDSVQFTFDVSISNKVHEYLLKEDPKMVFIYGEWDPWFASAVLYDQREKKNMLKVVSPSDCHTIRISGLMDSQRNEVLAKISSWLAE